MKTLLLLASAIACAGTVRAQISTTLNRLPTGELQITLRNNSDRTLTAFGIRANIITPTPVEQSRIDPLWVEYDDSVVDPAMKPLLPRQERGLAARTGCWQPRGLAAAVKAASLSNCDQLDQIATAGIYSDGTMTGDALLLTRLMLRRSSMLLAIDTASAALTEAGKHNYPRGVLVEQFRQLVDSASGWYLFPEQQVGRGLFESIIGKLKNLPQGELGEPFPPSAFIAEETTRLKQMKTALWDSEPSLADGGALALKLK